MLISMPILIPSLYLESYTPGQHVMSQVPYQSRCCLTVSQSSSVSLANHRPVTYSLWWQTVHKMNSNGERACFSLPSYPRHANTEKLRHACNVPWVRTKEHALPTAGVQRSARPRILSRWMYVSHLSPYTVPKNTCIGLTLGETVTGDAVKVSNSHCRSLTPLTSHWSAR